MNLFADRKPVPWDRAQESQFRKVGTVRVAIGGAYRNVGIWCNDDDTEGKYLYAQHPQTKAMHQCPRKAAMRLLDQE